MIFTMPHLSPMNWLIAITMFWFIISLIMSVQWWIQCNKFYVPGHTSKRHTMSQWGWL